MAVQHPVLLQSLVGSGKLVLVRVGTGKLVLGWHREEMVGTGKSILGWHREEMVRTSADGTTSAAPGMLWRLMCPCFLAERSLIRSKMVNGTIITF